MGVQRLVLPTKKPRRQSPVGSNKIWREILHLAERFLAATRLKFYSRLMVLLLIGGVVTFMGCASKNYGDEFFDLKRAAHGKDVMWIPTAVEAAHAMLALAGTNSSDVIYDLGSGDGVIPIEAAKKYGVRAVGIEYNADLVALSQRNANRAGVENLVRFKKGDIFLEDFKEATVLTLYLGEALNTRLMPIILNMKPGTRIVSNTFRMDGWAPDQQIQLPTGDAAYLWIVPALIDGAWSFAEFSAFGEVRLIIRQKKQFFDGYLELKSGRRVSISGGKIQGEKIQFEFDQGRGGGTLFKGVLQGRKLFGELGGQMSGRVIGDR